MNRLAAAREKAEEPQWPEAEARTEAPIADVLELLAPPPAKASRLPAASPQRAVAAAEREAAEGAAAHQASAAKAPPESRSRAGLWLAIGLAGTGSVGLGAYFRHQPQANSGHGLTAAAAAARPAPPPRPIAPTALDTPEVAPATSGGGKKPDPPARQEARGEVAAGSASPPLPRAGEPEHLFRPTAGKPDVPPALMRAWQRLQADDLDAARGGYEQVLRDEPNNTDALNGLATIAARRGDAQRAEALYLRALAADPFDPTAQAGLIGLKRQADPRLAESRLKSLLAVPPEANPNQAILNFALGNLYAGQHRWGEAQQAYFRAYAAEAGNPDYAFNLAVSLDHLHQNKLAGQYYAAALSLAGDRDTGFDKAQLKRRLLELQP